MEGWGLIDCVASEVENSKEKVGKYGSLLTLQSKVTVILVNTLHTGLPSTIFVDQGPDEVIINMMDIL